MIIVISIFEASMFIIMSEDMAEKIIESIIQDYSSKNAELYSEYIGDYLKDRMNEIQIYAGSPIIKTMNWSLIKPYLRGEMSKHLHIYDNFTVADTEGNYMNTINDYKGNVKDREYFQAAMSGETVVSDPLISRTTGNQVAIVASPIINDDGNIIGMMSGSINLIKLSNMIKELKYNYPNSYSYIITKQGLVIAHPNEEYIMKENISVESSVITPSLIEAAGIILSSSKGSVVYTFDNIKSINYFHEIPGTNGWKLVIKIPLSYWQNPIKLARNRLLFIGLVGFLIAAVLGQLIAKSISKPIVKLKNVFIKAAEEDPTVRAEINTKDEIGKTAESFNKMMDTISRLTFYDTLTNLPNRILFNSNLELELAKADSENSMAALMIFDIDKFENINNTLGHDTGDKLLICIADRISSRLKDKASISRIGDDKFALILSNLKSEHDAVNLAVELLEIIKQPWCVDKYKFYITAGVGIAYYPKDAADGKTLFRNAFSAMHKAKRIGRDTYQVYDRSMNEKLEEQLNLDSSMHNALDNGEFQILYQPQIDTTTGEIVGCEALLRWCHPELGIIPPSKFIPVAEANGLILPIGEWVLRTACRQNKKWQDEGYKPIRVSVNISAAQLMREDFICVVSDILNETQLPPQYLELEITETAAAENSEYIAPVLEKLRTMGIRIALDDFGTGYSSLNYLKSFPLNTLKIDRSFITDIGRNPRNAAIVSAILAVGHSLDLSVTAEGVETDDQFKILKDNNCDMIQGYMFSKPLPKEEIEKLLA